MNRPSNDELRSGLIRHTQALRLELKTAFERPGSEVELALQRRINEIERIRPGRGPAEAAQEMRAGQLRDQRGALLYPSTAPGADAALARASDHAAKAFESQLLTRYPDRFPAFDLKAGPNPGAIASASKALGAETPGTSSPEHRDSALRLVPTATPASGQATPGAAPGRQSDSPGETPSSRAGVAPSDDPVVDHAAEKFRQASQAEDIASGMRSPKQNALEAAGVLKKIGAEDKLAEITERQFIGEMSKMYRDPGSAAERFEKIVAPRIDKRTGELIIDPKRLDKALRTLAENPKKLGALQSQPRTGPLGAIMPGTTRPSKLIGPSASSYADAMMRARVAQFKPISYTDPAGKRHIGRSEVRAAATRTLTTESLKVDKANFALKRIGGLHGSKLQAAKAMGGLSPEQMQKFEMKVAAGGQGKGMKAPAPGLYNKIMALQQTAGALSRAVDPM